MNKQDSLLLWPDIHFGPVNLWNMPMLTPNEIRDKLKKLDETILLEVLEISSEEIVDRFDDKIEEREDYFAADLDDGIIYDE